MMLLSQKKSISTVVSTILPLLLLASCSASLEDDIEADEEWSVNASAASNSSIAPRSIPFVSGKGYPYYRTPAIVKAADGTLLAFAGARDEKADDSEGDIVLRRSADRGFRWEAQQVIAGRSSTDRFAIPIPVVLDSGKIILLYNGSGYVEREEDRGCRSVFMKTSTDNGKTWSSRRDITSQVQMPCKEDNKGRVADPVPAGHWGWTGLGPSHGIVKQQAPNKGRILVCARRADNNGMRSYVIYSDDHGSSWSFGNAINQKSSECALVELPNGNVMLNARRGGETFRVVAVSANGGKSFGPAWLEDQLPEPSSGCEASMLRHGDSVLFSNPNSKTDKTRGTLRRSTDGGMTWTRSRQYNKSGDFSGYTDLVRVNNGVGVLVEWGPSLDGKDTHKEIRFIVVPNQDLGL